MKHNYQSPAPYDNIKINSDLQQKCDGELKKKNQDNKST